VFSFSERSLTDLWLCWRAAGVDDEDDAGGEECDAGAVWITVRANDAGLGHGIVTRNLLVQR
jgi:hypothetical protein